jgi:cytochrome c
MKWVLSWSVLGVLTSTMSSQAGSSPDVTGRALALDYCSACHRVSPEQAPHPKLTVDTGSGTQEFEVPSFWEIANRPGRNSEYLHKLIQAPHYPMREQLFIPDELDQLVSYIMSLKGAKAQW